MKKIQLDVCRLRRKNNRGGITFRKARRKMQYLHIFMFLVCKINFEHLRNLCHTVRKVENKSFNFHQSTKPYTMLQLPRKYATFIPYLPWPAATHTTPAGRVLDWVWDPTQGSVSLAFSCTGPVLVPVLPARCHRCSTATGSPQSGGCVLHFPSCHQKTVRHSASNHWNWCKEGWLNGVACFNMASCWGVT